MAELKLLIHTANNRFIVCPDIEGPNLKICLKAELSPGLSQIIMHGFSEWHDSDGNLLTMNAIRFSVLSETRITFNTLA